MTKPPILKPAIATDSRQNWTKGVSQTLLKCLSIYTKICPAWEIFIEPLFDDVHAKLTEMFTMPRCPPATKGMSAWLIEIHFLIHKHKYWYDTLSYCLSSPYILLSEPSNYIFTHKTEGYTIAQKSTWNRCEDCGRKTHFYSGGGGQVLSCEKPLKVWCSVERVSPLFD